MDGLVFLFVIISLVCSVFAKAKKTAQQSGQGNRAGHTYPQGGASPKATRRAPKPEGEQLHQSTLTAMERPSARTRPAQPRIHARVDEPYVGSLGGSSTEGTGSLEGQDPCHDAELAADQAQMEAHRQAYAIHDPATARPALEVVPDLGSQQALVQAFVMSEILARPVAARGRLNG